MCLILFAWRTHPDYRLVVAANRDEFHLRDAEPLQWWSGLAGTIAAGRDTAGGGTWMGMNTAGQFAAVTNVREGTAQPGPLSRGQLPLDFLESTESASAAAQRISGSVKEGYAGYNLLVADDADLWWISNRSVRAPQRISSGIHGLSNAELDTPWPKVQHGSESFAAALAADDGSDAATERYFELLHDTRRAPWRDLPRTGVSRIAERRLSAAFVDMGEYGTRSSTVVRVRNDGSFEVTERRFGRLKRPLGNTTLTWPSSPRVRAPQPESQPAK